MLESAVRLLLADPAARGSGPRALTEVLGMLAAVCGGRAALAMQYSAARAPVMLAAGCRW